MFNLSKLSFATVLLCFLFIGKAEAAHGKFCTEAIVHFVFTPADDQETKAPDECMSSATLQFSGLYEDNACCAVLPEAFSWGFYAHQLINRLAVFTLPPEMLPFYKRYIQYITENAVNPDRRRYAVKGEAERHYIDIDVYGDSAHYTMPRYFEEAVALYTEDTLRAYGIVPWHVYAMKRWLTRAMQDKNAQQILRLSADMGHYIADAHVPLHTTLNYNGQLSGQKGIHAFWESRLPELFAKDYNFFTGRAEYVKDPQQRIWQAVTRAHEALDSVLSFERQLSLRFGEGKKFSYEERNGLTVRVYSREFSAAYHDMLQGQVERQMRASVKMIGDFWYTCWVDAGQPDLWALIEDALDDALDSALLQELQEEKIKWEEGEHSLGRDRRDREEERESLEEE